MDIPIFDFLRKQLGLKTDPADPAGSLHGKVSDLKSSLLTQIQTVQKPRGVASVLGSYTVASSTLQTVLNITGKGRLIGLAVKSGNISSRAIVRVTIDGNVVIYGKGDATTNIQYPTANILIESADGSQVIFSDNDATRGMHHILGLEFKTSLKIELSNSDSTVTQTVYWLYTKE